MTAETYLFVPGYPSGRGTWLPLIERAPARCETVIVDLPDVDPATGRVATLADQEDAVVRAVEAIDGRVTLVGHSLGSYLVARACGRGPQGLVRAVHFGGFAALPAAIAEQQVAAAGAWERGDLGRTDFRKILHDLVVAPDPPDPRGLALAEEPFLGVSPADLARFIRRAATASAPAAGVGPYDTPTRVVHGTDDRAIAFALGEALARLGSRAELVPIDGAGHSLPIFHAERMASLVYAGRERGDGALTSGRV